MNLKIAYRFLINNKLLSLLSIIVLSLGMSSFILIFLYIQYEKSYDSSWSDPGQIYRVILEKSMPNGNITTTATNFNGLCRVIADEIPGVEAATGFQRDIVTAYTHDNYLTNADFFWCDTSFFKVFDQPFVAGDRNNPFPIIQSAVISEKAAIKLFGNSDPVGQRFKVNEGWEFIVSGVFADIPENSHLKIDILVTRQTLYYFIKNFDNRSSTLKSVSVSGSLEPDPSSRWLWDNPNVYTYFRLKKKVDKESVMSSFSGICEKYTKHLTAAGQKSRFILQPVQSIHLDSKYNNELSLNSEKRSIAVLYVIAILALAMSWIIFINFQITQSIGRAKEIGLKKVIGAGSAKILSQIVLQSVIINIFAILLAFSIFFLLSGGLSVYLQIPEHILVKGWTLVFFVAVFIAGSILSSIYPAYILISKNARQLLSEKFMHYNDGFKLRRLLIVFQYAASVGLMIITFVIIRQVWYMKNKEIGLSIDQTVYSYTPMSMIKKEGANLKLISFMEEAGMMSGVISLTASSCIPGIEVNFHSNKISLPDKPEKRGDNFGVINIDHHFQDVFGPKILAGRMFRLEDKPGGQQVVINREACKKLGFDSPQIAIGKFVQVRVNDYLSIAEAPYLICGVVEDFHQESPRKIMEPLLLIKDYRWKYDVGFITLRFKASVNRKELFEKFKAKWESFFPDDPFEFHFTADNYKIQLKTDENLALLSVVYTGLSMLLAALGLYGLAANSAKKRVKEIGIRKINGAKISEIISLLNRDFMKWIAISFLIAFPLSWFIMHRWLENFAYKTSLDWWIFLIVGFIALSIALLTVSWHSRRAALMNPVEALRNE